jgi:tRNA-Thr(GGU) m(6)t(6)A37 methyltransferase TsaA
MENITLHPIGIIRTPHQEMVGTPIQPVAAEGVLGHIELLPEYVPGLKDLAGFSHITLVYFFHKIKGYELEVVPFMDTEKRGIFACKAPKRPNALGLSTVKLLRIEGNILHVEQVDMLDNTPLLDIKPFYPKYDNRENVKIGWLENLQSLPENAYFADDRFRG